MIVGIHGKARSGKDTFADFVIEYAKYTNPFAKLSFADPIYNIVDIMFNVDSRSVKDKEELFPEWDLSLRYMLQTVGTEMGRHMISDDIWIRNMQYRIDHSPAPNIIIPDVRFENEAHFIRKSGGFIIFVERTSDDTEAVRKHISENGVKRQQNDMLIENNSSLGQLERKAIAFARESANL